MFNYNDNELLYLINEHNEYALKIMYDKYLPLIKTRIKKFNIRRDYEDFIQEGYIALNIAIKKYKPFYNKSFNKYFDLILQRRFIQILRKDEKHFYRLVYCDISYVCDEVKEYNELESRNIGFLSNFEKDIFKLSFEKGYKAREIAEDLGVEVIRVYNALGRIKKKIKEKE